MGQLRAHAVPMIYFTYVGKKERRERGRKKQRKRRKCAIFYSFGHFPFFIIMKTGVDWFEGWSRVIKWIIGQTEKKEKKFLMEPRLWNRSVLVPIAEWNPFESTHASNNCSMFLRNRDNFYGNCLCNRDPSLLLLLLLLSNTIITTFRRIISDRYSYFFFTCKR